MTKYKKSLIAEVITELRDQFRSFNSATRTHEFWLYTSLLGVLLLIGLLGSYFSAGFDDLTRLQLKMTVTCQANDAKLGTIIVGAFVFVMSCVFTLGEVTHWIEAKRRSKAPGRQKFKLSVWRPLICVGSTVVIGVTGIVVMFAWC